MFGSFDVIDTILEKKEKDFIGNKMVLQLLRILFYATRKSIFKNSFGGYIFAVKFFAHNLEKSVILIL